jgi:hypothetical protein
MKLCLFGNIQKFNVEVTSTEAASQPGPDGPFIAVIPVVERNVKLYRHSNYGVQSCKLVTGLS